MPEETTATITGLPDLPATTESEQMYLITVARAAEAGASGPMPVAALAADLGVSVASANEMIRKLASKGLVEYFPYKGVELSDVGARVAGRVLRTRRLWATFLAGHLDFSPAEADALACHLEHVTPVDAAERLADYLGDPAEGPLGRPIPPRSGTVPPHESTSLVDLPVGTAAEIASSAAAGEAGPFLTAEGIVPGTQVTVLASGTTGVLLEVEGRCIHLADAVAASIDIVGGEHRAGR